MKLTPILVTLVLMVPCVTPKEAHMPFFVFEGSWFEMGRQYGENCTHIEEVYDSIIGSWKNSGLSMETLKEDVELYRHYVDAEKEISDFMRGIAARLEGDEMFSEYEKVIIINSGFEILWLNEWHQSKKLCTAMGAFGEATKNDHTIVGLNRDLPYHPFSHQIAYVLKPESGQKIFGTVTEGQVASNFQVNSDRLFVGAVKVLGDWSPENGVRECAYGLPSVAVMLKLSMCNDVDEALRVLEETQVTQGMNYMLAEPSKCAVVEKLPFHYAVREAEGSVIALTNQMRADHSYESGRKTNVPMNERIYQDDEFVIEAGESCYWSTYWALMNRYGDISPATWMNTISRMDYCYDENGSVIREKDGVPVLEAGLTVEYQYYDEGELTDGTVASHCCDLDTLEIYWVQGLPSTHHQWQKVDLDRI
jgi:hypothetical protein